MTEATAVQTTIGGRIKHSPAIQRAIDAIVADVSEKCASITDVRGPIPELKAEYEALMARAGAVKGRPLLYPYLASGAGNGALVELGDGSVKWDMITGIGVHFLGHSNPAVIRAQAEAALEDTTKHGNLLSNFDAYGFGEKLLEHASRGSRLKHAFITTSGAVANESALKVCYQKRNAAPRVIAFRDCFMGRTVTMAQVGDSAGGRQGIPLSTQVDYMPFWSEAGVQSAGGPERFIDQCVAHLDELVARYPEQHACFIFELVQGEGGFNTAPREFFVALMERCRKHGIPVWDDEIQSFGRTTEMFAYDMLGLGEYVDVFCVGKMTQACATLWTEEMNPKVGLLSGTFTGSSSDFTVGGLLLDTLAEGHFYGPDGSFARHFRLFGEQVRELASRRPEFFPLVKGQSDVVGGVGGMMRFTPFGGDKDKVNKACKACFEEGVICFSCGHGPYHVRFLPPLPVFNEADWPRVFACVERALAKVS